MKSIQSKILLVVISGLLVITAVVSAIAVNMTHAIMHKDADRILKNATQREAAYINDVLGDVVKSASIMEHYATQGVQNAEMLRDPEFLAKYLADAQVMFTEVALNTTGIEGFYLRMAPEYTNGTTGFYRMLSEDGKLTDMPITDLTKYDKDDKQNVGWYYGPVNMGKGIWMEPYYFPGHDNQLISYVQPLYAGRDLIGVVGFDMNFHYLTQRIDDIGVYEDGHAVLLGADGVTVYNTVPEGTSHNPHTEAKTVLKNGMYLELYADYKDIQRDIHPMLMRIVLAFVCVLALAVVYTVIVTHKIVGPLKNLTAAAENLSNNISQTEIAKIPVDSKDEIGTLARVLSGTYAKIQEYTAYINMLAYRDSLTGIKNTTAYTEATANLNKEIQTGKPRFGVLVADINNLKQTNDKYGHDIGNSLITRTAKILSDVFKDSPVFRIGGDEFAVILQGADCDNYRTLLAQMDEACKANSIYAGDTAIPLVVARGVTLYDSQIDKVYEDVFAKADHAMYMHKDQSKTEKVCV